MRFSGFDHDGESRNLELPDLGFFLATLYVPKPPRAAMPRIPSWSVSSRRVKPDRTARKSTGSEER